jgi:hypothetical protein
MPVSSWRASRNRDCVFVSSNASDLSAIFCGSERRLLRPLSLNRFPRLPLRDLSRGLIARILLHEMFDKLELVVTPRQTEVCRTFAAKLTHTENAHFGHLLAKVLTYTFQMPSSQLIKPARRLRGTRDRTTTFLLGR